jgi:hypothetical protein
MKIKFFEKSNNFKRKDSVLNQNLYWETAVFGEFILIIISFIFGYYLFAQINKIPASSVANDNGQVPTIDKVRIEKALNYFSDREQKSKAILNSPAPVVDPSL